jgi:hypothetical protein
MLSEKLKRPIIDVLATFFPDNVPFNLPDPKWDTVQKFTMLKGIVSRDGG